MLFGFKTQFGGGNSTGFCLIYDNKDAMIRLEPSYRLRRNKLIDPKQPTNRRSTKELKNKKKKYWGKKKTEVTVAKKR
jgi:small subunit ribosomal protein S24e